MKSKIQSLENQNKHMEGSHGEGGHLSDIYPYQDLTPKFRILNIENMMGIVA